MPVVHAAFRRTGCTKMKALASRSLVAALAVALALTSAFALADDNTGTFETVTSGTAMASADVQDAWTPPTAEQLDQLLAPVAVFPDSLVAQVLAAASHPEQVSEAAEWRTRNPSLKGAALESALAQKDWDPGVKAVAGFPDVLNQMASNLPWTRALGEAYVNDPTDVLNAVQSLRNKAVASGKLKSNQYLTVRTQPRDDTPPPANGDEDYDDAPPVYDGPAIVDPPEEIVEIAPAQPDIVYVPYYDPWAFYGYSIAPWPGYAWAWPAPVYYGPAFGLFGFGVGISLDFGLGYPWGWHAWNTRWWGHRWHDRGWRGGWHGPSVVYNHRPYFNHSRHIINHFAHRGGFGPERSGFDRRGGASPHGLAVPSYPRSGFAQGGRQRNAFRGPHTPPSQYARLSAPRFDRSMAQRGSFAARRAGASEDFARQANYTRAALPSSRYAPRGDMQRAGNVGAMRGGYAMSGARAVSPSYTRGQANARSGYASAPTRSYAQPSYTQRSYGQRSYAQPQSRSVEGARYGSAGMRSYSAPARMSSAPSYSRGTGGSSFRASAPVRMSSAPSYSRGAGGGSFHASAARGGGASHMPAARSGGGDHGGGSHRR